MHPSPAFLVFTVSLVVFAGCLTAILARLLLGQYRPASEPASDSPQAKGQGAGWMIIALVFGLLAAAYFVLRFHALWMETDTATITLAIQSMLRQGVLLPSRFLYQHGFGYQSVSVALVYATALSTQSLQTVLYPFLAAVGLILTSYVFFREVLRDHWSAALASLLLICQPEVLFATLRGSHEKMTWPLMMLALTLLYRSFGQPLRKMVIYIGLFYLVVFAIDSTNVFFGSVFLVAVVLSMTLGFLLFRFWRRSRSPLPREDVQRLMYISSSCGILIYIFIAYIYPPALVNLRMLQGILSQLSALLLSFEIRAQPYGSISTGWVNSQVYLALTIFTWLVILVSFLGWLRHGWKMFRGETPTGLLENLDWLLYAGFAIQIAVSILVDFSGALSANMQLRLLPSFTVMAIILLVRLVREAFAFPRLRAVPGWILPSATALLCAWFALSSMLKATNEPLLSNKWTFYLPPDKAVVGWIDTHLENAELWTGVDERLSTIFNFYYALGSQGGNHYRFGKITAAIRYVVATELDRERQKRIGIHALPIDYWDQIYDNGQAQVEHIPAYIVGNP